MHTILISLSSVITLISAASLHRGKSVWQASNFNSLVTFGDSYTDENGLNFYGMDNYSSSAAGIFLPETFSAPSGGRTWPRYVVQYTGQTTNGQWDPSMTLYNYAISGAVCSNEITPRTFVAPHDFPAVLEYELPNFIADLTATRNGTSESYFTPALTATDAAYAIFIGTNDLGVDAFLTDSQVLGKVLTDYTDCVYNVLDGLYANGARVFVLMNTIPLQLAPLYANDTLNGVHDNQYWPMSPANKTQVAETMHEYTTSVNNIYKYQTPYEALVAKRYPGASFANFDVWSLIADVYDNPSAYLNGTQPLTVEGYEHHCMLNGTKYNNCVLEYDGTSPDSFLWYDELHPSEQTDRVIARNFIDVLNGASKYATYY